VCHKLLGHSPIPLLHTHCKEPLIDQMIKLVTNKLTGNSQFHGCHLWVNLPNVEMLRSSGQGVQGRWSTEKLWNLSSCYSSPVVIVFSHAKPFSITRFQKIVIDQLTCDPFTPPTFCGSICQQATFVCLDSIPIWFRLFETMVKPPIVHMGIIHGELWSTIPIFFLSYNMLTCLLVLIFMLNQEKFQYSTKHLLLTVWQI
jgi:hypothetical protein